MRLQRVHVRSPALGDLTSLLTRLFKPQRILRAQAAVSDYDECMSVRLPPEAKLEETRGFQFLAYYQKEMSLYTYHNLDRQVNSHAVLSFENVLACSLGLVEC